MQFWSSVHHFFNLRNCKEFDFFSFFHFTEINYLEKITQDVLIFRFFYFSILLPFFEVIVSESINTRHLYQETIFKFPLM